jgi:drug/metabolite transporter (DMT)-like permease
LNSVALALVLCSALLHATWNLLAKRAGGGGLFVWFFTTLSSIFLVPAAVVLVIVERHEVDNKSVFFICGTSLIHLVYFIVLQRAYKTGDLSLVYPLARGLGPALATVGAILLLNERPSYVAVAGLLLILTGIVLLTARGPGKQIRHPRAAILYGTTTGVLIAIYTVWDKYAVDRLAIPPLLLEAFAGFGISLMLTPTAVRRWDDVKTMWCDQKTAIIGVAVLAPLSYILILTAMSFTALSYVAPCREISILFAAILASRFLNEGHTVRRVAAACLMVGGVIALALG